LYTVSYKLQILSYWIEKRVACGPTRVRERTREEVAYHFKVPAANLSRWRKGEGEEKFVAMKAGQRRVGGGGQGRRWVEIEKELFERFWKRRAQGRPVRRSWFRQVSPELFQKNYPLRDPAITLAGIAYLIFKSEVYGSIR